MAIRPSESPNILVKEFDLSGVVPAVTSSTGALVGDFNWGPVEQPILVGNEAELVSTFGSPSLDSAADETDFLSAAMFLKYSGSAFVTRVVDATDRNAVAAGSAVLVKNLVNWEETKSSLSANKIVAKYPGTVGNSLKVSICPVGELADSAFDTWTVDSADFSALFDGAPGTSSSVSQHSGTGDEVHVVVYDEDGKIGGAPGTILETYSYLSLATDAKKDDGATNYIVDVLNNNSRYVWISSLASEFSGISTAATFTSAGDSAVNNYSLGSGVHTALDVGDYKFGFDRYEDEENIQVDFLVAP